MILKRLAIVTNVIPVYRKAFYERVLGDDELSVTIFCQEAIPGMNLAVCHQDFAPHVRRVRAWSLQRERLAWQRLPMREMLREFDGFLFYGNPRVLSNVVHSLRCRRLERPVGIWGQAHTAGASGWSERLRLRWWSRFDHLFVYTDREVEYLRSRGIRAPNLVGMNNGLDQQAIDRVASRYDERRLAAWRREQGLGTAPLLLSCARLEPKNRFDLALEALARLAAEGRDFQWAVIGDGAEASALRRRAAGLGLEDRVRWVGALYEESQLAPWFLSATAMVHPGAIGLSLLHAFGYGLPVVTHDDADRHMPEFAAMESERTGLLFREGSVASLADAIGTVLADPERLRPMRARCLRIAREEYNVDCMAQRFRSFAERMLDGRR